MGGLVTRCVPIQRYPRIARRDVLMFLNFNGGQKPSGHAFPIRPFKVILGIDLNACGLMASPRPVFVRAPCSHPETPAMLCLIITNVPERHEIIGPPASHLLPFPGFMAVPAPCQPLVGCLPFFVAVMGLSSRCQNPFVLALYASRSLCSIFCRHMGHRFLVASVCSADCRHSLQKRWPAGGKR